MSTSIIEVVNTSITTPVTGANNLDVVFRTEASNQKLMIANGSNVVPAITLNNNFVGIGLTNPANLLEVNGTTRSSKLILTGISQTLQMLCPTLAIGQNFFMSFGCNNTNFNCGNLFYNFVSANNNSNSWQFGFWGNDDVFRIFGTSNARIANRFGVGQTGCNQPAYSLDVLGTIRGSNLILESVNNTEITFSNNSNCKSRIGMPYFNANYSTDASIGDLVIVNDIITGKILLQNGTSTSALCVNSNNTIGINTKNPNAILDVYGGTNGITTWLSSSNTWQTTNVIANGTLNALSNNYQFNIGGSGNTAIGAGSLGILSANSWRLVITSNTGFIGINKRNPAYTLDVIGDINFTSGSFRSNGNIVSFGGGGTTIPKYSAMTYSIQHNTNQNVNSSAFTMLYSDAYIGLGTAVAISGYTAKQISNSGIYLANDNASFVNGSGFDMQLFIAYGNGADEATGNGYRNYRAVNQQFYSSVLLCALTPTLITVPAGTAFKIIIYQADNNNYQGNIYNYTMKFSIFT